MKKYKCKLIEYDKINMNHYVFRNSDIKTPSNTLPVFYNYNSDEEPLGKAMNFELNEDGLFCDIIVKDDLPTKFVGANVVIEENSFEDGNILVIEKCELNGVSFIDEGVKEPNLEEYKE